MEKVEVLFVDDEKDFRFLSIRQIARILKDHEFHFIEACDGAEALELLKGGVRPSIIILDYIMPKVDGIELLRKIDRDHNNLYDVPRVMISGYNCEDIKSKAKELRCDFLEKVTDTEIFFQELCQHMSIKLGFSAREKKVG